MTRLLQLSLDLSFAFSLKHIGKFSHHTNFKSYYFFQSRRTLLIKSGHSTETVLLNGIDRLCTTADCGKALILMLLNLCAAFTLFSFKYFEILSIYQKQLYINFVPILMTIPNFFTLVTHPPTPLMLDMEFLKAHYFVFFSFHIYLLLLHLFLRRIKFFYADDTRIYINLFFW